MSVSSHEHVTFRSIAEIEEQEGVQFGHPYGVGVSDALNRYGESKMAQVAYHMALGRKHPDIQVLDMCPGPVASDIAMNQPFPINVLVTRGSEVDLLLP